MSFGNSFRDYWHLYKDLRSGQLRDKSRDILASFLFHTNVIDGDQYVKLHFGKTLATPGKLLYGDKIGGKDEE